MSKQTFLFSATINGHDYVAIVEAEDLDEAQDKYFEHLSEKIMRTIEIEREPIPSSTFYFAQEILDESMSAHDAASYQEELNDSGITFVVDGDS